MSRLRSLGAGVLRVGCVCAARRDYVQRTPPAAQKSCPSGQSDSKSTLPLRVLPLSIAHQYYCPSTSACPSVHSAPGAPGIKRRRTHDRKFSPTAPGKCATTASSRAPRPTPQPPPNQLPGDRPRRTTNRTAESVPYRASIAPACADGPRASPTGAPLPRVNCARLCRRAESVPYRAPIAPACADSAAGAHLAGLPVPQANHNHYDAPPRCCGCHARRCRR